jgi:hypothetical protein
MMLGFSTLGKMMPMVMGNFQSNFQTEYCEYYYYPQFSDCIWRDLFVSVIAKVARSVGVS